MKSEWITAIAVMLMMGSLIVGVAIYYKQEVNACTSNPLMYGANEMEKLYGYEFVGTGYLITPINIRTGVINFNKDNISFQSNP